jgi:hypothetical protein
MADDNAKSDENVEITQYTLAKLVKTYLQDNGYDGLINIYRDCWCDVGGLKDCYECDIGRNCVGMHEVDFPEQSKTKVVRLGNRYFAYGPRTTDTVVPEKEDTEGEE